MQTKKLVSIVLAVLMLMSVIAIAPASAAETDKTQTAAQSGWYLWG